jgi:hypothetical protein
MRELEVFAWEVQFDGLQGNQCTRLVAPWLGAGAGAEWDTLCPVCILSWTASSGDVFDMIVQVQSGSDIAEKKSLYSI